MPVVWIHNVGANKTIQGDNKMSHENINYTAKIKYNYDLNGEKINASYTRLAETNNMEDMKARIKAGHKKDAVLEALEIEFRLIGFAD